jgi:hypothetical protein
MITEYHEMNDETDEMLEMIHEIAQMFEDYARPKLHTAEILEGISMNAQTGKQLSVYLDKYDIHPRDVRVDTEVAKGYHLNQFRELFGMHGIEVNLNGNSGWKVS